MFEHGRQQGNIRGVGRTLSLVALALTAAAVTAPAQAQPDFPGGANNKITFGGGDIFTVSGSTITVTGASTATTIHHDTQGWTRQLLGINGIWVVDSNGNALANITVSQGGGLVTGPTKPTPVQWTPTAPNNVDGFTKKGGFALSSNGKAEWLQIAPTSLFPANQPPSGYTTGSFTFAGLATYLASQNPGLATSGLYLGIDYFTLVSNPPWNTDTGRGFGLVSFEDLGLVTSSVTAVPEPGVTVFAGLFSASLVGLVVNKRRKAARASA